MIPTAHGSMLPSISLLLTWLVFTGNAGFLFEPLPRARPTDQCQWLAGLVEWRIQLNYRWQLFHHRPHVTHPRRRHPINLGIWNHWWWPKGDWWWPKGGNRNSQSSATTVSSGVTPVLPALSLPDQEIVEYPPWAWPLRPLPKSYLLPIARTDSRDTSNCA